MRGVRSFLALLIILIGLGAYLYFVERERTPGAGDERAQAFTVAASDIQEIAVRSLSGERTVLRRDGDAWRIVEPIDAPADPGEVSGLTSSLSSLRIERALDGDIADLAEYGLAEPRMEVRFTAGGEERRLAIGGKTPPGSDLYARVDDEDRVILIASYLESTFNRGTFDLRDKTIIRAERESVDTLVITSGGRTTELARADGEWRIAQPFAAPADYSEVNGLVTQLMSAQMRAIEDAPKPDAKAYGLEPPAAAVRAGSVVLHLGRPAEEGTVYARVEGRPVVFTVDATLLEALRRDPGEYRQKDLFNARAFNSSRVEITRAGATRVFEKQRVEVEGKEEERWRQVAPSDADVDGGRVDSLIFAATAVRAESFIPDGRQPPASPELTIVIRFDDGKREDQVSFWRSGDETFARRADAPGAARISGAALDDILKAIEEIS